MLEHAAGVLLIALVVLAPLMIGSRHAGPRFVLFTLGAVALALGWRARAIRGRPIFLPLPTWFLLLMCLGCLVQLVPLPAPLLRALSPAGAQVLRWAEGSDAIGGRPASLDPAGTLSELAKLCGYLTCFLAFATYCRRTERARRLEAAVVSAACAVTLLGLLQASLDPTRILFFYEPRHSFGVWLRGTFVNPNHFGAFVALAAPVALVRCLRARRRQSLLVWLGALLLLDAATLLSFSRGAVLGGLVAHLAVLLWAARRRLSAPATAPMSARALVLMVATGLLAYLVATGSDRFGPAMRVSSEIDLQPASKVNAWRDALPAIAQHPWLGQGRGAMTTAFARHSAVAGRATFPWLENGYLQLALDFGLPIALLLALLLLLSGYAAARGLRPHPDRLGALAGLFGLAVHDLADFAVELPGVALPALALAAVVVARRADEHRPLSLALRPRPWLPALAVLPVVLAVVELANPSADSDARALAALASTAPPRAPAEARRLLRRHPADYTLPLTAAEALARTGAPEALPWVNHAMFLNPRHPRPHVLAALYLLAADRRGQALLELRLAARGSARPRDDVWPVVARHFRGEELLGITADDPALAISLSEHLRYQEQRHAEGGALLLHAVAVAPRDVRALQEAIAWQLTRTGQDAPGALAEADALLGRLLALDEGERTLTLAVRTALKLGAHDRAVGYLGRMPGGAASTFASTLELGRGLVAAGALDRARSVLGPVHDWDLTLRQRAELHGLMAALEERAGNPHRARWEAERKAALGTP